MRHGIALLFILLCFACGNDQPDLKPLNLLKYGLAVTIQAPDSAKVKMTDMGIIRDISVSDGEDYAVQIFASQAMTVDIANIKSDQMSSVKNSPYFSKIIKEEDNGFIFENKVDSTHTNYGFRYIQIMGDQEIVYQPGTKKTSGFFSLEEIEYIYESVKVKK